MARDPLRGVWLARAVRPAKVLLRARLRSTNQLAAVLLESGQLAAPALIAASLQTAGHGQRANTWWSDDGSLCATFVLAADDTMPIGHVPLRAGLAVARVIEHLVPDAKVRVKWPNDVFADGRKIAGILCARARGADIIGIGLNVRTDVRRAPREVRERAVSLSQLLRRSPRRDEVLAALWHAVVKERSNDTWADAYRMIHHLQDQSVVVTSDDDTIAGIVRGIDEQGRLLIERDGVTRALTSGTVEPGPPAPDLVL